MKKFALFCLLFLAAMATVRAAQGRETLTLPASGCSSMMIDCGAGELKVQGKEGVERIEVSAVLHVQGISDADLPEFKKEHVILKLEKIGSRAVLTANIEEKDFMDALFGMRDAHIDLDVSLPRGLGLVVDDGSGDMQIKDMASGLEIDDGSGDMTLERIAGGVKIDDGSGDIFLTGSQGDVDIEDGSGDIELKDAGGDVAIEDGSGEINVYRAGGSVEIDDGSGDIIIDGVEKDVTIDEAGSGGIEIHNVKGKVRK